MGHVNNATYLDVMDEALAADREALAGPRPPVRYEVEYLRPALPRAVVSVAHGSDDGGTAFRFLDPDGQELVRARLTEG
jgi:acyl-ACP thioesterase